MLVFLKFEVYHILLKSFIICLLGETRWHEMKKPSIFLVHLLSFYIQLTSDNFILKAV